MKPTFQWTTSSPVLLLFFFLKGSERRRRHSVRKMVTSWLPAGTPWEWPHQARWPARLPPPGSSAPGHALQCCEHQRRWQQRSPRERKRAQSPSPTTEALIGPAVSPELAVFEFLHVLICKEISRKQSVVKFTFPLGTAGTSNTSPGKGAWE